MWWFSVFLAVPIIEIALVIKVGGLIGLWPTLLIVILTAFAGTWLFRLQSRQAVGELRKSFQTLDVPTVPLAHGTMLLLSGLLLLTPGFFTDAVGVLLLIPKFRVAFFRFIAARVTLSQFQMQRATKQGADAHGPIIEGEFEEIRTEPKAKQKPSGWVEGSTRH